MCESVQQKLGHTNLHIDQARRPSTMMAENRRFMNFFTNVPIVIVKFRYRWSDIRRWKKIMHKLKYWIDFFFLHSRILGQNVISSLTMKTECILLWNPFSLKIPVNGELRWVSISWTLPDLINFSELFMSLSLDPVKIFLEKVRAILASMSYSRT